ncbi:MAG: type II toxin-antitoxin system HipA family toxin [Thiofilum sp.]|uniref:type II toxin-antitoxin system HipA family toxin n=1 Tax=Thiofilum sp. TaxID=2212733 RepID=UPI0025F1677F|nr:type II toxin-antitoxin system HipA family toxin [Thiofilum sp.]MBK8452114.1 type II toxin-antitoxin system HipA family toxin [Thiofilum sp.]
MQDFTPIEQLTVWRRLAQGERVPVGQLTQNRQGIFFQYAPEYLDHYTSLSPFNLRFDASIQLAPKRPHGGLHGVFADSLPDGWGLMLMDRVFRQVGVLPHQVTPLDRLAFIGQNGMGALEYEPVSDLASSSTETLNISELGLQAQALFEGQTKIVLAALVQAGSSGGARPKAQLYLDPDQPELCSTTPKQGMRPYLVKFTSSHLPLGHEESLCEAAYLTMAKQAGINTQAWQLLPAPPTSGAKAWLALERFDCTKQGGRLHLHSAAGLLDANFREPSLDYEDLIKASSVLCKEEQVGQEQFRRAIFNLFALNQDDHAKNWAFLMDDKGQWLPSPFYDVTFSPNPYGEHATAYGGYGKNPPLKALQHLATIAGLANWQAAQLIIHEVTEVISTWEATAKLLGISQETRVLINRQLTSTREKLKYLT